MNSPILTLLDFAALSPLLILLAGAMGLLLVEAFAPSVSKKYASSLTLCVLFLALLAAYKAPQSNHPLLTPWLAFDSLSRFFNLLFISIGVGCVLLASAFFRRYEASQAEYYFMILSLLFGMILIGASADFLTLFIGIETFSIPLYILCCYMKNWKISHEAAIKYFLTGALAGAFLLYGIALIYGAVGSTQLNQLLPAYQMLSNRTQIALFLAGIGFITVGLGFKIALVPFHSWAPDVYEGAPNPVTAFMAIGTKAGAFAAFIRIFLEALPNFNPYWSQGAEILVIMTLVYANTIALRQIQLRRFFAYSSISHSGFLLIPIIAGSVESVPALLFYLIVYSLATFGCFAVLAYLDDRKEGVVLEDFRGLFRKAPILAAVMTLSLFTLAGLPPTAGFFAKFYIFKVAFQQEYYSLVVVGLLTTILSVYYYLRIVSLMLSECLETAKSPFYTWPAAVVGAASFTFIAYLSFYP